MSDIQIKDSAKAENTKVNSIEKKEFTINKPKDSQNIESSQKEISFADAIKAQMDKIKVELPTIEQLFESGVQFGHETKRWHPLMGEYIYLSKENIHILDLYKTLESMENAAKFLKALAIQGKRVMFVGTKKQASKIIREESIRSSSYFVDQRWVGGLLSNLQMTSRSFKKLRDMENAFEEGVEGRTKYEISQMKKEWSRLNRLYSGSKTLQQLPDAIVVVDAKYERGAVREAQALNIPVIALVDTNTNPKGIDYVIPSNDDAISSIKLIIKTLSDAISSGNNGRGVQHNLKDYSKVEVKIIKVKEMGSEKGGEIDTGVKLSGNFSAPKKFTRISKPNEKKSGKGNVSKGILERVQKAREEDSVK